MNEFEVTILKYTKSETEMKKTKAIMIIMALVFMMSATAITAQDTKTKNDKDVSKTTKVSDDKLRNETNFNKFIKYFFETCYYKNNIDSLIYFRDEKITKFYHPKGEFGRMTNPGVFCTMIKDSIYGYNPGAENFGKVNDIEVLKIYKGTPVKGFCEESTSKTGIYVNKVKKFPKYYDHTKEKMVQYRLPGKLKTHEVMKVVVVVDKWIKKQFYFAKIDKKWYLIISDDCDCSA